MAAAVHRHRTCVSSRGDICSAQIFITVIVKAEPVPLQFRGASLHWGILFQRLSRFRGQLTELLLTRRSVSVHSEVAVVEGLSVGWGVKPGAVVGVEGLLWFGASGALLTSFAELGTGLAQVS